MNKEELNEENLEEEESEDTSPETQDDSEVDDSEEESTEDESQHIDYKKKLEKELEKDTKSDKSELEKAQRALFFNAQRLKDLGGDPNEVLGVKAETTKEEPPQVDLDQALELKFAERDAQQRAKSEDEYQLIMHYVKERNLSVDDAYYLANKERFLRKDKEVERSNVQYQTSGSSFKPSTRSAPKLDEESVKLLERRGLRWNSKTQSYRGKFSETFYNHDTGAWESRKLQ